MVVLDALVAAIRSDDIVALGRNQLLALYETLLVVSSKPAINKLPLVNHIWQTLSNIRGLLLPTLAENEQDELIRATIASPCAQAAIEAMRAACVNDKTSTSLLRSTIALNFILSLYARERVYGEASEALGSCFDGVLGMSDLPKAEMAESLLRFPQAFEKVSSEKRQALFDYFIAQVGEEEDGPNVRSLHTELPLRSMKTLDALIELANTSFSTNLRLDLLQSLSKGLQHSTSTNQRLFQAKFSESMLMRFPTASIPRALRQQWLDQVFQLLSSSTRSDAEGNPHIRNRVAEAHLAFMVKMMEIPNTRAEICKNPELLLDLYDANDPISADCGKLFAELVRRVLSHAPSQSPFARNLAETILERLDPQPKAPQLVLWYAMQPLIPIVDPTVQEKLLLHEVKAFTSVDRQISKWTEDLGPIAETLGLQYDILIDSIRVHWNLIESTSECKQETQKWHHLETDVGHVKHGAVTRTNVDLHLLMGGYGTAFDECFAVLKALGEKRPSSEETQLLADLKSALLKRPTNQLLNVIDRIDELSFNLILTEDSLRVLQILLSTLPCSTKSVEEIDLNIDVLARLANELGHCNDARTFGSICSCVKTVISERSWPVSQYGIDTLLRNLTLVSSVSASNLPVEAAGGIYSWVCAIATTTITLHRIKLQGRLHLLMPLLINLLNCLFVPYSHGSKNNSLRLPPWLSIIGSMPISSKCSAAFARLLSTLSSPTISSASSYKRRRENKGASAPLKDETKLARTYVGEYIPIILTAYCSAQLNGKIENDVKAALMFGLWSCMETVEMDAWRVMSERMKENERAIWQSVWAEWKRIGGGRHTRDRA